MPRCPCDGMPQCFPFICQWFDLQNVLILPSWKTEQWNPRIFRRSCSIMVPSQSVHALAGHLQFPLKTETHHFPGAHTALSQWLAKLESAETQQAVWKLLSEFHLSGKVSYLEAAKKRHHYAEVNKLWLQNEVPRGKWWKRHMILYDTYIYIYVYIYLSNINIICE